MSNVSIPKRNNHKLLIIIVMLCAPVAISYFLFFSGIRPASVNYGALMEVTPLQGSALNQADETIFRIRQLRGKWVLLSVGSSTCDEKCNKNLYYMRQVRTMQNAEKSRIERVWLIDDGEPPQNLQLAEDYKGMFFINAKDSKLLEELPAVESVRDHIYMIDPLGNLMMRFPKDPDPIQMAKDIKRLLKVSQIEHALNMPGTKH
ncbi:MAG: hypothetical protein ITD31_05085 [Nitrosospira sp.]|nr:hypothetical protein [Nitrosospira sp.]